MKRLLFVLFMLATPAFALDPTEMLSDPVLEARAEKLDLQIRCVKCQSEAIATSNADWARDARKIVRELIAGGKTDQEVIDWFYVRYGDFVLMKPKTGGSNTLLWAAAPVFFLLAIGAAFATIRMRSKAKEGDSLSDEEQTRLSELLND